MASLAQHCPIYMRSQSSIPHLRSHDLPHRRHVKKKSFSNPYFDKLLIGPCNTNLTLKITKKIVFKYSKIFPDPPKKQVLFTTHSRHDSKSMNVPFGGPCHFGGLTLIFLVKLIAIFISDFLFSFLFVVWFSLSLM